MSVILASGSIRRKEIFESHGISPVIMPMDVDETLPDGIAPDDAVMFLSLKKGLACEAAADSEHALIVSADTIVYAYDIYADSWRIMGKPQDDGDAWRMLSSIRGASHKVMTGVSVICPSRAIKRTFCDITDVYVKDISDGDLHKYIESGEPKGKAGGYAIQLGFGSYIDHIEGDYENVVGFPYDHFISELSFCSCPIELFSA
ncbi:MAG: septum formation protein Maf [Eubacterium sp.]|nr:septum formation protein Maf [Eubacterium sp.]